MLFTLENGPKLLKFIQILTKEQGTPLLFIFHLRKVDSITKRNTQFQVTL